MGEVYRARDTRQERTVTASPEQFSNDPDLKQRFEPQDFDDFKHLEL